MSEKDQNHKQFDTLEARLAGTLRPVQPTREHIHRMRSRVRFSGPRVLSRRLADWEYLLIVVGGVASVTVFLVTVARFVFNLMTRRSG
jgi:hypothetical protein